MPRLPFLNRRQSGNRARPNSRTNSIRRFRRSLVAGLETLESRQLLAADVLLADSFEAGSNSNDWVGNWVEDSQNDWFRSTQRATDGSRSAEVDGSANDATLTLTDPIDLSTYDSAELTFDWLIESGFDSGEYLALDISSDGGSSWNISVLQLDGNSDPENQWQSETVDLTPYKSSDVLVRFRAKVSRWNEDANVDNVKITGERSELEFPATISYPDFSDSTGLTLLGDAAIANGNTLRLTPAASSMSGSAWHVDKQFVSVDWETSFDFNLNENFGDVGGSDGFTFVIQNHAPTYLRNGGGTLGYEALPNSLVVEFDTFLNIEDNPAFSDTSQSAISIQTAGTGPNFSSGEWSIASYDTPSIMDDAQTHQVRIAYIDGVLSVYYDSFATPVIETPIDLNDLLDLDGGKAWLGFTAATGGGYQNHDILNWEYRVLADTSSTFSVGDASVVEGDSGSTNLVFEVTRAGDVTQPATIDWSTSDGSATAGVDYSSVSGQLSFDANESTKWLVVPVVGDVEEENFETLQLQLSNPTAGLIIDGQAIGTIENDDTSISISDATVTEGDSTLSLLGNFVSEDSGGLTRPRLLAFGPDGNNDGVEDLYVASADTDEILLYDGVTGDFLGPFASGEPLLDNPIGLAFSPINGDLYVVSGSNVLRLDDTTGDLLEVVAGGLDKPAGVSFFRSGPRIGELLITERNTDKVFVYDGTDLSEFVSSGSGGLDNPRNAVVGPDGDVYVASRDSLQVLKYSGVDGGFIEVAAEIPLFSVSYLEFGNDGLLYVTGKTNQACCENTLLQVEVETGSVLQTLPLERDGWSFTVGPNNVIYSSGNGFGNFVDLTGPASNASFEVTLSRPSAVPVTIDFATLGVSATSGLDFLPTSGSIIFEPGVTSRNILVTTLNDDLGESDETFELNLSNAVGATLSDASGVGTIQDDGDPTNQPPNATDDNASTAEDQAVVIDVLANDSDPEGDAISLASVTQPSSGLAEIVAGQVQYTPAANFNGPDSFTYTINDTAGNSATATVDVTVTPVNDAPVSIDDSVTTAEDTPITISVLENDSDLDGDALSVASATDGAHGSVAINADNTLTYTPNVGFFGSDSFSYTISDGNGGSSTANVLITVEERNDPPLANNDTATTNEDVALLINVLDNDSDPDGDSLSIQSVTQPANGSATIVGDQVRYTPTTNYNGSDSFTYTIVDTAGNSATASVNVTITAVNDAPVATGESYSLDQDTTLSIDAPGVLANDSDVEGDALTAALVTGPSNGLLTLNADGSFLYTADAGFVGNDSFSYQAVDTAAAVSDPVTVSLQVDAVASGPKLSHGVIGSVSSNWQTVALSKSYDSAVIVATPRYNTGSGPGVVRISNVTATSFDVRVDNAGSSAFSGGVHFIAMEEGVYDVPGEYKLEAVKIDASTTSGKSGGWQIGSQAYQQSYSSPVVVGQVMSANDADWSVFWSSSSSRTSPASSGSLNVGKHVGEDSDTTRAEETLGYFVIEATNGGMIDGLDFTAGVGSDTIRGVDNGTYQYSGVGNSGATTAVLSTAGMDGADGGWAALIGSNPLSSTGSIALSVDEDQLRDSERKHTTEQVAYFVIGGSAAEGEASALATPQITVHDPLDVNGDGFTSPIDALQVINALNTKHESLVAYDEGDNALDTNGDGNISPIDALLVINKLNANNLAPATNRDAASIVDGYFADLEDEEETLFDLDLV